MYVVRCPWSVVSGPRLKATDNGPRTTDKQNMTKIKTGIIGTGFIGPAHVEALRRLGFVDVAAVAERGDELAAAKAKAMSIAKAYGDYRKLLADPEIQVVHNCTPNHLHFAINKEILAAKKHIISRS